jgi:enolase-phosphatase E1
MRLTDLNGIVLDIEGTTSPISFVHEVMYGYARRELLGFLTRNLNDSSLARLWDSLAKDAGAENVQALAQQMNLPPVQALERIAVRMMDADAKATALKELQGQIWKTGFESGELKSEVFEDVPRALERWTAAGIDVRVYSSGSVVAQKIFFGRTRFGDLQRYISGWYDTTTGPKREARSYANIAKNVGLPAEKILFLSDVVAELDAARKAGMQTGLMLRPGNAAVDGDHTHLMFESFDEIG